MGVEIEVDGIAFAEVVTAARPVQKQSVERHTHVDAPARQEFLARMDNWRKVVHGPVTAGAASQYCAGWAKLYVHLRTSEAPPAQELLDEKYKPLSRWCRRMCWMPGWSRLHGERWATITSAKRSRASISSAGQRRKSVASFAAFVARTCRW